MRKLLGDGRKRDVDEIKAGRKSEKGAPQWPLSLNKNGGSGRWERTAMLKTLNYEEIEKLSDWVRKKNIEIRAHRNGRFLKTLNYEEIGKLSDGVRKKNREIRAHHNGRFLKSL